MANKFKIRNFDNIKMKPLDYMTLLYDKLSGVTHIIAEPVPQIIEALGQDIMSAQQIQRELNKHYDMAAYDDVEEKFSDIIEARLEECIGLGFIEKISVA